MTTSAKTTNNEKDLFKTVLYKVCIERARQGYENEIEFCKKHNIKF